MSTQTGTYFIGTFGFPITITLSANLAGATGVSLRLTKPSGTVITRDLTTVAITTPADGIITFSPLQTEVDQAGVYTFVVTVSFTGRDLTSSGQFLISPNLDDAGGLVVETGTGNPLANSYVTVVEADAYHVGSLYADKWYATSTAKKAAALRMATRVIDARMQFRGYRSVSAQALAWPRTQAINSEYLGSLYQPGASSSGTFYAANALPKVLKDATSELAMLLLTEDTTADAQSKGIKSFSIGGSDGVSFEFDSSDRKKVFNDHIIDMLSPLGSPTKRRGRQVSVVRA